ncbi:DUF5819 family protein [Nesterenkonia haasae]|uniref:DUF5819 family protein n=1 Tax=Nesterenkonia haasae TaxID=2587813 RepID=UPI001391CEB9|nr:DUF5819 family protein [Nesterenkonia haasae]NDK32936.1 hypothetical protein [Nesterenkonia haasae]
MHQSPSRRWGRIVKRVAVLAAVTFTAWHLFATFLWIAPRSDLRDVVPGEALTEYMIPLFGQSWSVFAPEPINGDYYFDVRAIVDEGGEEVVTEWVRASNVEQSLATYRPFPPRAAKISVSQASALRGEWHNLTADNREIVELNYYEGDDWSDRLQAALEDNSESPVEIENYLREERRATAYATQVAQAIWGDNVTRVQYQVARQNVIPWAQRHNPHAERPEIQPVPVGWRGVVVEDHQSQDAFADYFCSAPQEICVTDDN